MKIAARFPIKSSTLLCTVIIGFHILLTIIVSWMIINTTINFDHWLLFLFYPGLIISGIYCYRHYLKITSATDDLCWNGHNWLIYSDDHLNAIIYLKLKPQSWVSNYATLLHFSCEQGEYQWFFSRTGLGKRTYSYMVYLVKQDLKNNDVI